MLKLKQGKLLHTIINLIKQQKIEHEKNGVVKKQKFTAFSTQDWILQAVLNGIGAAQQAIGETIPEYNALIIFELKKFHNGYGIQVFYKKDTKNVEEDITKAVRRCNSSPCPFEIFIGCCDDYITDNPLDICEKEYA
ncbi:hypothetical protein NECAME_00434 [Necator americanus]|nr:hypothetical protein NECAME_00434 [Necator americanus]ETN76909.1 hypothetical protein NECAME_00434 [Necator americanus]